MSLANLDIDHSNWDDITLTVKGDAPAIVRLQNQDSCLELNRVLTIAYFEDHEGPLDVTIDGINYTFPQPAWEAILSVTDQWLERYAPAEYPELFAEQPKSAEIIPLFA